MRTLSEDTAVDATTLVGEGRTLPPTVSRAGLVARLRRLVLPSRAEAVGRPRVVGRRGGEGPPRSDVDAGLTRGAYLLFGAGPRLK